MSQEALAKHLKSSDHCDRAGSSPAPGTTLTAIKTDDDDNGTTDWGRNTRFVVRLAEKIEAPLVKCSLTGLRWIASVFAITLCNLAVA